MKQITIIGIDPGVKTGVAFREHGAGKFILSTTTDILTAMDLIRQYPFPEVFVFIEDPNLRKWYGHEKSHRAKAQGAGSVKRDYSIWVEFFKRHDIAYKGIAPKDVGALSPAIITKLTGKARTSVHERDAICLSLKKPLVHEINKGVR